MRRYLCFDENISKPESKATAKHKWQKLTFDPNTKLLSDFLEDLNESAEKAFVNNVQHMIDNLLHTKLPSHLKPSLNLAYTENGTYDQVVARLGKELEFSGLENDGKLSIPTRTAVPPNDNQQNSEQSKIVCRYCKQSSHVIRYCSKMMKKEQEQRIDLSISRSKPQNLRHLYRLHTVLIANEQIILQKIAGTVPMPLIDPHSSNKTIQQTIGMKCKNKEI